MLKFWLDDLRPAPNGWLLCESVEDLIETVNLGRDCYLYFHKEPRILVSLDNDLGEGMTEGYRFLDWLEENGIDDVTIHIHTDNVVAKERMKAIIERNDWEEVK